jgi:cell division septal protein FtsQ
MWYSAHSKNRKKRDRWSVDLAVFRRIGTVLLISSTALLVLLKLATWLYADDALFRLKDINIRGNKFASDQELLSLIPQDSTKNLLKCDLKKISLALQQHPLLEKVWVKRVLPSTLFIRVKEYEPLATYNKDGLGVLDSNGHLLQNIKPQMLIDQPIITDVSALSPKDGGSSELAQVLAFLEITKQNSFKLYARISEISFNQEVGIYFYLTEQAVPVIVGTGDYVVKGEKFLKVIRIIEQNNNLDSIEYFDLRFKNQVVVKEIS